MIVIYYLLLSLYLNCTGRIYIKIAMTMQQQLKIVRALVIPLTRPEIKDFFSFFKFVYFKLSFQRRGGGTLNEKFS